MASVRFVVITLSLTKWKVTTVFLGLREDILLWTIFKCYASHVTVVRVISEVYDMARPKVKDVRYMNVSLIRYVKDWSHRESYTDVYGSCR